MTSVLTAFQASHQKDGVSVDCAEIVEFLIESNIISSKQIRRHAIQEDFRHYERQKIGRNKSQIVRLLARQYGVHENTVWQILAEKASKKNS